MADRSWTHPRLGRFVFDGREDNWIGEVPTPAFAAFTYTIPLDDAPFDGRLPLYFSTPSEDAVPTDAAAALAVAILDGQAHLVPAVARALWEDFNGRGPRTFMWWRGHLADASKTDRNDLPPLTSAEAVMAWLMPTGIRIFAADDGSPLAELTFAAEFEQGHNVGVLTDAVTILGLGYELDRVPFEPT